MAKTVFTISILEHYILTLVFLYFFFPIAITLHGTTYGFDGNSESYGKLDALPEIIFKYTLHPSVSYWEQNQYIIKKAFVGHIFKIKA